MSVDDGIRDFWAWWQTARHQLLRAIEVERTFSGSLVRDISSHVNAIGDLDWELSPGKTARHAFCLSPRGDAQARLITERGRRRGPAPGGAGGGGAARRGGRAPK